MEITKSVYAPYVQELNDRFTATLGAYLASPTPLTATEHEIHQLKYAVVGGEDKQ
jgi:hypothetical protein